MIIKKKHQKQIANNSSETLLLKEHFAELSKRFYYWLFFFIVGLVVGYSVYNHLLEWLIKPLGKPLFYTSPTGGFEAVFGVCVMFGFIFSLPVLIYQIVKFIEPTSNHFKGKQKFIYILASLFLAVVGIVVSYYLVFPSSLHFLNTFGGPHLESLISTTDYFPFIIRYLAGFAILFQLPLVIYIVGLFVPISPKLLLSKFKYVFTLSFVVAAILTPTPDLFNQVVMATPIILLYFITILILFVR